MPWPKGKPRGPQKPEHRVKRAAAISAGQRRRFADPVAREKMSEAIWASWQFGALHARYIGDNRMRRVNVQLSEQDWAYLRFLYEDVGLGVSEMVRLAITRQRERAEADIRADGAEPVWETVNGG